MWSAIKYSSLVPSSSNSAISVLSGALVSMASSSLSSSRGLLFGQKGSSFSWYINTKTAIGTGSYRREIDSERSDSNTTANAHRATVLQLTLMRAMIQKAYDTFFSSTGPESGELSGRFTGDLKLDLKWWIISVAFSVLLLPGQWSDMKGSAIRGLNRAPRPMKKCRAWTNGKGTIKMRHTI